MIDFRLADHSVRAGVKIVEVWSDDVFIATITPGDFNEPVQIRVISKYLKNVMDMASGNLAILTFDVKARERN